MCTSTSMYVCVNFTRLFEDTSVLINTIRIFEYLYAYVVATVYVYVPGVCEIGGKKRVVGVKFDFLKFLS